MRPIQNSLLRKFLAIDRFKYLFAELKAQSAQLVEPTVSSKAVLYALLISLLPLLSELIKGSTTDLPTVFVGIAACVSVLYRRRLNISFKNVPNWQRALQLTHTAFAVGCIPIVALLIFHSSLLYTLGGNVYSGSPGNKIAPSMAHIILTMLGISVWAGLTEELIFRALLISVIRRWNKFASQEGRDRAAILISAFIFGLSHLPTWGAALSFALMCLGVGFGMAFIATGELLLPLVLYHAAFDFLSLAAAILTYRG